MGFFGKPPIRGLLAAAMLALAQLPHPAAAGDFPSARVTIVVPFPAGGPTDALARILAAKLQGGWVQPVVTENRPGGGTVIGSNYVARAAADGHTLLFSGDMVATKIFSTDADFDPRRDLRAVSELAGAPFILVTPAATPAKTLPEFIAYARARPDKLNAATIPLSNYQIQYPLLFQKTGMSMTLVPYSGGGPITTALLQNDVQLFFAVPEQVKSFVEAGRLTALASTGARRDPTMPGVPTARESGIDYENDYWFDLYVPRKTADGVADVISAASRDALHDPEVVAYLKKIGLEGRGTSPAEAEAHIQQKDREYRAVARKLGILAN